MPLCTPVESAFERVALPVIEQGCGSCHGEEPAGGAPFSLLDYDDLVRGPEGSRIVDRIVARLVDGTMPPANATPLTHDQLDTLTGWASCGLVHAPHAGGGSGGSGGSPADCEPLEAAFANTLPIIERRCGECHGERPSQGAPFSLLDYDDLVAGEPGERIVDRMVKELADGTMPPPGTDPLTHEELDTLTGWASCGLVHPDPHQGLVASREPVSAPPEPPAGSIPLDLVGDRTPVAVDDLNKYVNLTLEMSDFIDHEVFVRRFEPVIDEARVLHHITLQRSQQGVPGRHYLYAWGPGGDTVELPGGGLRIAPTDRFFVELHYNNGAGVPGVKDSSGIRLWVTEPEGTEYGMNSPGTWKIVVPPGETTTAEQTCVAQKAGRIIAGFPHMHETGRAFHHTLTRVDGTTESIIDLTGYNFDAQRIYEMGVDVQPGDRMTLQCVFHNTKDYEVVAGPYTENEMCFDFMYVSPPGAFDNCDAPKAPFGPLIKWIFRERPPE